MKRHIAASALLLSTVASTSDAATLVATAIGGSVSNFSIEFVDQNMDGLLDIDEAVSFSGVQITNSLGQTFDLTELELVAQIDTVTTDGTPKWLFSNSTIGNYDHATTYWTYEIIDTQTSPVPLPGALALLLSGLGLLAARRFIG